MPYTHTSNPLCERQNRLVEQNVIILMKQERTKDCVRLVPWALLTMNSQRTFLRLSPPTNVSMEDDLLGSSKPPFLRT